MLQTLLHKIGNFFLLLLGLILVILIFSFVSDAIFHWAGSNGVAYELGYALGHFCATIWNLF